ncbi:MAG: hypothetical protein KJ852_02845 [Gammaproteobacteria bacterium]|nr:hypothetical protein [Gammaproteobacteria bacterium]MBU0787521.1 hypothetical protein [Gammaproteobacteria bacterium]MBU0815009.1 hypothetical protein [Gammaproteobacteria bacterium]MBU1785883.1 hypothetical protein [Gammaproteobacteria bacterium]
MPDDPLDLNTHVFAKTELGQQEIQSRALKLAPRLRSALIVVDGHRTGQELVELIGADITPVLKQLLAHGCIESLGPRHTEPTAPPADVAQASSGLSGLPPAASRDAKAVDMARNFMMNSINTMFGQNMRLSLIEAIHACQTAEALRQVYPSWEEAMASSRASAKRLPELREKLFVVL